MTTNGTAFIYRGALYRFNDGAMVYMRKLGWGRWEWAPIKGFAKRKILRAVTHRVNGQGKREG